MMIVVMKALVLLLATLMKDADDDGTMQEPR